MRNSEKLIGNLSNGNGHRLVQWGFIQIRGVLDDLFEILCVSMCVFVMRLVFLLTAN